MASLEHIIEENSKKLSAALKDLYVKAYMQGAKDVATKAYKESLYDEAVAYYEEQQDWIESHFQRVDSEILHSKLSQAISEGQSFSQFWQNTKDSGMFDASRAERIFRTETNRAYSEGTLRQYEKEGVQKVNILLGPTPCPICTDIAMSGSHNVKDVSGLLPVHPNCSCVFVNAEVSTPGGR